MTHTMKDAKMRPKGRGVDEPPAADADFRNGAHTMTNEYIEPSNRDCTSPTATTRESENSADSAAERLARGDVDLPGLAGAEMERFSDHSTVVSTPATPNTAADSVNTASAPPMEKTSCATMPATTATMPSPKNCGSARDGK